MKRSHAEEPSLSPLSVGTYVARCTLIGFGFAVVYSAWVTIVYAVRGTEAFDKLGTTLSNVILLYVSVGLLGGAFVGLMWKLCRYRFFAYLTSILVGALLAIGIGIILEGLPGKWDVGAILGTPLLALIYGVWFGGQLRKGVLNHSLDWATTDPD